MDNHATEMRSYYRKRAVSYDQVYLYPERQSDLRFLEIHIPHQFKDLKVLEIAAGTGYWSQFIIGQAASLLATDVTAETLVRIKQRCLSRPIQTRVVDAFSLNEVGTHFNGAFAGLWFSHIKKQQIPDFLTSLHACLQPGSRVIFLDNAEAQCKRSPLVAIDNEGNTYQDRELEDGSVHRILKNFPGKEQLIRDTADFATNPNYLELENFWLFQYAAK